MRDLICDVKYCSWAAKLRYGSNKGNDASASSCFSLPWKAMNYPP